MGGRVEHGTPEGYARGCTKHEKCPALTIHGLTCFTAHIRFESGERRYMQARARDPRAAAIAKRLGISPAFAADIAVAEHEAAIDEEFAAKPADYKYRMSRRQEDRVIERALAAATPKPAQPLAESSQDTTPQEDAGTPAIEEETPTLTEPAVEAEEMGPTHDTTREDHPMPERTPTPKPRTTPAKAAAAARERKAQKDRQNAIATPEGRAAVRAWATRNGHPISDKGRIPADIVYAYVDAAGKDYPTDPITFVPSAEDDPFAGAKGLTTEAGTPLTDAEYSEALAGARERAGVPEEDQAHVDEVTPGDRHPLVAVASNPDDASSPVLRHLSSAAIASIAGDSYTNVSSTDPERPDWALVAATTDPEALLELLAERDRQLEQARSIATRLEAELARVEAREEQGLAFLLRKHATDRAELWTRLVTARLENKWLFGRVVALRAELSSRRGLFGRRSTR